MYMKHWYLLFALFAAVSCTDSKKTESTTKPTENQPEETLSVDQKVRRHIQNKLKLTAADKYSVEQYKGEITGDDSVDVIITVNLMDRALNEAKESGREEKVKEMGYMGYYNYFFVMDGATKELSEAIVIPSSPMYHLNVAFTKVLGANKQDFTIDSRVRNMQRRHYYTMDGKKPLEICQSVIFDNLGTPNQVAYSVRYEPGTYNEYNDIVEYEGRMEDLIIPNIDSTYSYTPTIEPTDTEVRRWHYSPSRKKYFLIDANQQNN